MAYIDELLQQSQYIQQVGADINLPKGAAYASYYPTWETQTPQYIQPNAYTVEQAAFRVNEFVYSIIIKRASAEGKGHMRVNDITGKSPKELKDHPLRKLIRHPNKGIDENLFWAMKRISQDLAGFSAWEIEYNMIGEPMRLWFMRPDWCSFKRAQQDPLAYIRYQPYGLQAMDIPLVDPKTGQTKILFFSNGEDFDPLYPGVKFYSPAMHALPQIKLDNAMTFFLNDFVEHGAKPSALLSVAQTIDEPTSKDYQDRWVQAHGGVGNWSKPIVLGLGVTHTNLQMSFKDMAFSELDARTESRICNTFNIETIVADARAGLDVSSYNNKEQATKNWFYGWVSDTWETNGEVMTNEMLPIYEGEDASDKFNCDFDVSKVYAMQEDRTQQFKRAGDIFKNRVAKLNEARKEAGLEPIEGEEGESFYEAVSVKPQEEVNALGEVTGEPAAGQTPDGKPIKPKAKPNAAAQEAQSAEEKKFRAFAKRRIKEGKSDDVSKYEFKFLSEGMQKELIREAMTAPVISKLDEILKK
jgi:HK97 family phage portal protein